MEWNSYCPLIAPGVSGEFPSVRVDLAAVPNTFSSDRPIPPESPSPLVDGENLVANAPIARFFLPKSWLQPFSKLRVSGPVVWNQRVALKLTGKSNEP
jgi:hypothetical protein